MRLFIQPYEAAAALKHFKTISVILYDVKTFPPTIAASARGFSKEPFGISILVGFIQP